MISLLPLWPIHYRILTVYFTTVAQISIVIKLK